jgi:glycosyltransferase involved in cell wall biosynthesis
VRVLHVITGLGAGGAEVQLDLLLRHTRHSADVATLYNFGAVGRKIAAQAIKVHDLGMRTNRQVSCVFRLADLVRKGRYDVVHVHLYRACIYGRIAACLARAPTVVTTEHSLGDEYIEGRRKTRAVRWLYLATDRFSDATIAVSPRVRDRLISWGVEQRKIRVIPNGLDFERFAFDPEARETARAEFGIGPKDFVVGSVGRLHLHKRHDLLLEATVPLLRRGSWLLLVGEGSERSRLQRLVREAGVGHRTIFAGEREDIPQLLSTMDVFAAPSQEETFGLAAIEALASGLPVVVAECPALDGFEVKGVRRIPLDTLYLRRALLEKHSEGFHPEKPDDTLKGRYDIRAVAAAIDEFYESLLVRL